MVYFASFEADSLTEIKTYLDGQGIIYNPGEDGLSTDIAPGMNIIYMGDDYADMSYLGQIPNEWDEDGNPIGYTTTVHAHLASKVSMEGMFIPTTYRQNRFAGEFVVLPLTVSASSTKTKILEFMKKHLIPHHDSWTKEKLLAKKAEWVNQ